MGLLDNLQSQVDKIREEENKKNAQLQDQEAFYESHLKPVMIRIHEYFAPIIKNLNIVAPEIYFSYPLNPLEKNGVSVKQSDYRFHSDSGRQPREIDILAQCNFLRPVEFYIPTKNGAANYSDLLELYTFPYHRKNKQDMMYDICGATFYLEGPIESHIRVSADPAEQCINILVRNIENQPIKKYRFSPDKVDDKLLERLAKLLIREESTLVEVEVCKSVRDDLKLQIEEDRRREEAAIAKAYAEIQVERQEAEDAKLVNRTKRAFDEGNKKIFELIANLRRSG